jgi:MscS family membrane protein
MKRLLTFCLSVGALIAITPPLLAQDPLQEQASSGSGIEKILTEIVSWDFMHIEMWRIAVFLLIMFLGVFVKNVALQRLLKPLEQLLKRTETDLDDEFIRRTQEPLGWLILVIAFYVALLVLGLPEQLMELCGLGLKTFGTIIISWFLFRALDVFVTGLQRFTQQTENDIDDHLVPFVRRIFRVVLFVFTCILVIQQWGYDVTSLIAGLGIGGLAFALAAQDTVANWFGSVMIVTDRPFRIGDWVKTKYGEGIVEEVGLRSTTVRTFGKTLISVPNKELANTAVENFSEMTKRRIKTTIGLTYDTTESQMNEVLGEIRLLLEKHEAIDQEYWLVNFVGFSESSLDIFVYAFTHTTVWKEWLDTRQEIFLAIMKIVEDAGTSFAFPSTSLYVEKSPGTSALGIG